MTINAQFSGDLAAAECLCSQDQIHLALDNLATNITRELKDTNPVILGVMVGALIPLGHLLTRLNFPLELDYVHATRYRGAFHGGELHWLAKPHLDLANRTVLIFDDIMDGGLTLAAIMEFCKQTKVKALYSAVMISKLRDREAGVDFEPDFVGINTPDRYLFGFGLDYNGCWRTLPDIYAI
jgi:hypoxanthine phosphoribosyltransferase